MVDPVGPTKSSKIEVYMNSFTNFAMRYLATDIKRNPSWPNMIAYCLQEELNRKGRDF